VSDAGDKIAAYALSVVGLTAPDPEYLSLVAPWEAENDVPRADSIATESDCGLVAHGLVEHVVATPIRGRYVTGSALADLKAVAVTACAYEAGATLATDPAEPGDVLHFGPAPGHPEHMGTVVGDGVRVDGGERDDSGHETIVQVSRALSMIAAHVVETATGRPVLGVIRAAKMADHYGLRGVP